MGSLQRNIFLTIMKTEICIGVYQMKNLQATLREIDGKSYKLYKKLQKTKAYFDKFQICFDYIQGDPFASPSKIRIVVPKKHFKIQREWLQTKNRKVYVEDRLTRKIANAIQYLNIFVKGSGKSGLIAIDRPGQEILERTSVQISNEETTICLSVGLPANGRRINGKEAEKLLLKAIVEVMKDSLFSIKQEELTDAYQLADQHDQIRATMKEKNWIAFIADGSILPRESGISEKPLKNAVPFQSPEENRVQIKLPHTEKRLTGMAIPKGITLIVGGGYHGKSTLLQAIERGVYPHVKGDGREFVLTDVNAVKIRAEDGRQINTVNISPFINNLPHGENTTAFRTANASGSTSQAANVMEALEVGATTILIDEDTSATNFMIRDERMQRLVAKEKEPITPFIDKIKQLKDELNVSTILVVGGSGDYFDVCDQCIMLDEYRPINVTKKAKEIVAAYPQKRQQESDTFGTIRNRIFLNGSVQSKKGNKSKIQAKGLKTIVMGKTDIDLQFVEQLIDTSQTRMIAEILQYLERNHMLNGKQTLQEILNHLENQMEQHGLASITARCNEHPGDLAKPRRFEIAAALNRIRTAKVEIERRE